MANDNDEIVQLIIDAKNLSTDTLNKAAKDLDGLGDKAKEADDALDRLKLDNDTINSYREMKKVTAEMKRELAESEVKYTKLTAAIKNNKNVTDEQLVKTEQVKQALKEERAAVNAQVKAYEKKKKELKELGVNSQNYVEQQKKLTSEIKKAEAEVEDLTRAYEKQAISLKEKYTVEKKASEILKDKIRIDEKAAHAENESINISRKKTAADKAAAIAQTKLTANLKGYEAALDKLNKEKNEGIITTGKYIRSEEKLRKTWKLNEAQAKSTRRAVEADNKLKSKSGKSTDALTSATRRLAQAYTVLLAAQKATEAVGSSVKGYSELEAAITKVEKTTGIARDQVVKMADELRYLSEEVTPTATNELLRFAETAGQMGVNSTEDILKIVSAADALAVSTNLAGEEAATLSARILGMTGEGVSEIHSFASALVELGNSTKTTEQEILHMTKEIVTGTTALGFGSAAAAGFGATLKELGQPAERSRSALQDLSTVIINMANEGGDSLEKLIKITGLTGAAIEEGLGKEPEQVVIKFIEGLKGAKDAGTTLKTSLAGVGITSKETNAVVGVLAENTERLSEVVGFANDAYEDGNAHIKEASKRYADQEATLLRLSNKFTTLKTKIGEAYAPKVIEAVDAFSDAMDENGSSVVKVMELIPELVEGFGELLSTADDLFAVFGGLGDVFDNLTNAFKLTINQITFSIRTLGLGLNELKIIWAELSGDTEENINRMKAASADIAKNMTEDLQDMENAQKRFDGTSSAAYENFINVTNKYKDAISELSIEQQVEIELLLQSNSATGEAAAYNAELENSYRKLATVLTRANNAKQISNKLEVLAKKPNEEAVQVEKAKAQAIKETTDVLDFLTEKLQSIESLRSEGILTDVKALEITNNLNEAMRLRRSELLKLTVGEEAANIISEKANNLNESWVESAGKRVSATEYMVELSKRAGEASASEVDSLTLLNGEILKGAELTKYLSEQKQGTVVSSNFFTQGMNASSEAVRDLQIAENGLVDTIKKLNTELDDSTLLLPKKELLTLQLVEAEEALLKTQEQKLLQQELESKRSGELRVIQEQTVKDLELLDKQYRKGSITAGEYADKSEDIKLKLQSVESIMGDVIPTTQDLKDATSELVTETDKLTASEDNVGGRLRERGEMTGVLGTLMNIYTDTMERQNKVLDYSGDSTEDLTVKLSGLQDELSEMNKATMPSSLAGLDRFLYKMDQLNAASIKNEETTILQTIALNKLLETVESGSLSVDELTYAAKQAEFGFNRLGDKQLDPLRAAIKDARSEFQSLSDEINDTFDSLQDRLDRLKGDEASILSRQFKAEMAELEQLLLEARESGDNALIAKIQKAIGNLREANKIELGNLSDNSTSNNNSNSTSNNNSSSSQEYNVTITLPNGGTQTVEVASSGDANALVSLLSQLGEVNISGVG